MSTQHGDTPRGRLANAIAHSLIPITCTYVAIHVSALLWDNQALGFLDRVFSAAAVVCTVLAFTHVYAATLCIRCMRDVPVDASQQAERKKFLLRIQHAKLQVLILVLVAAIGVQYFVRWMQPSWSLLGEIPLMAINVIVVLSFWSHHRLRPWCPYCRNWGDGGHAELTPDPDPSNFKKVPQ